jgi:succinoglycan biosynthesis transport protein ExoP
MTNQTIPAAQNLSLGDIYYILFRHKWKIVLCTLAGIAAAIVVFKTSTPPYQSDATLLVRYIIANTRPTGPNPQPNETKTMMDERVASIMTTETEILNSADLARDVAEAYGIEKILAKAGGGKELSAAAGLVRMGLRAVVPQNTSVIHLSFRHPDPEIVQPVLGVIIERYLKRHVEAHRSAGMLTDQQTQELDALKLRLNQTEDELRRAMSTIGIGTTLENAKDAVSQQMSANRREVLGYETEVAGRLAVLEDLKKRLPAASAPTQAAAPQEADIPQAVLDEHRIRSLRVNRLQMLEQDLLAQFTPENIRVKNAQSQLAEEEAALNKLRQQHPRLTAKAPMGNAAPIGPDMEASEAYAAATQITAYQAKIKELNAQYERLRAEATKLDKNEGQILDLRRKKATEESHYLYLRTLIDQQRMSDIMGNGKIQNINSLQNPSGPYRQPIDAKKIGLCAVAGILTGLVWAFLLELYLDRSVRRPADLAKMLRAPLFLTIPKMKIEPETLTLAAPDAKSPGSTELVPAGAKRSRTRGNALQPFHETLRDRLIGYFESRNLTHKPKLVAVTGLGQDAGVTTTAAGLARSLSETGEGNVLLVDMTVGEGAAKQFVKGREACGLDELLEARSQGHVQDNLYVVTENNANSDRLSRNMPQRFARLIPKLKASDFDYIIFDMPVVNQLSITPRLAGFMDMVLLVVESETTDRDLVQSACSMLAESKAHVGVVLNKTRNYVPGRLNQEMAAT